LAAPVSSFSWRPLAVVAALGLVALLVVAPSGWGLPTGMDKDVGIYPANFEKVGCTACHGAAPGTFAAGGSDKVSFTVTDATGKALAGNAYAKGGIYNITITLHDEQAPTQDNHAGFNLRVTAGKLAPGSANTQVSKDSLQATHTDATATSWMVKWTAPDSGAVVFDIFVNDVNGVSGADKGDLVYRTGFWLTDADGAQLGAAAATAEVEYGISLQQYWIGLIGLAGMIFIMVAGYVFLKYSSRHNTDAKDR